MTSRPHDALFKAAFEKPECAAGLLRNILPASLSQAIAWDSMVRESGSFIDAELLDRQSDLLFSVTLHDQRAFVYLLLEHQSSSDADMPLRMLVYLVRIDRRPAVRAVSCENPPARPPSRGRSHDHGRTAP